ncbi:MAG: HTTM domain-containing protein [Paracoccaceae bacterium]
MMDFETALRWTELALAAAILQRSFEHIIQGDRVLFGAQIAMALVLLIGVQTSLAIYVLWVACAAQLLRFQGPYNGGADKMTLLCVTCLAGAHLAQTAFWAELALAYLAVQLTLSYAVSGWVKLVNSEWRRGRALSDVFTFSAYPVSERLRSWGQRKRAMLAGSWAVIGFEVIFPISLLHPITLIGALAIAAAFHFANGMLFGLNRFFWIWISAYPAIIWFQGRLTDTLWV